MFDRYGKEIKTGDVVEIRGGFYKSDNGLFAVMHSPGDPDWEGRDYGLHRITKAGKASKARYATAFWPIMVTTNNREERAEAKMWNADHAEIEVRKDIPRDHIADAFLTLADQEADTILFDKGIYGADSSVIELEERIRKHYIEVAQRICPSL